MLWKSVTLWRKTLALAGVSILAAGAAIAQTADRHGYYVEGKLGYNVPADSELDGTGFNNDLEFDEDVSGFLSLGYDYESLWRGEFELGYRPNDAESIDGAAVSGDADVTSLMANVFTDFDIGESLPRPFLGFGAGLAYVDANGVNPVNNSSVSDDDIGLAFQLIAGASLQLGERLDLVAQYAYFVAPDLSFSLASGGDVDADYQTQTFSIGLRYRFWKPPPPPPEPEPVVQKATAPEPEPAAVQEPVPEPVAIPEPGAEPQPQPIVRNFVVFFDWDKAELTAEARAIIRTARDYATQGNVARIVATGHADTSGAIVHNMRLSQRRADAVRDELVLLGFSVDGVLTIARGETDPLVDTPDGVREPQNRRVEIVLE